MTSPICSSRPVAYQPALAWFAAIGSAWVFVLVTLGAFTTSIGAGMAFPDWPLSNGSVNPHGWLINIAMFAEHSHRLSGTMMGLITLVLALWLWQREPRRWLRGLGWTALIMVVAQGTIGGTRVLLNDVHVPGFEMTLGQMLRIPHGILAQLYICALIAIAVSLTRGWMERALPVSCAVRRTGTFCVLLLVVQLAIAATMRHNHAGLAIPTFPLSTAAGAFFPAHWDYRVALNFAHRTMALVLTIALLWYALRLWTDRGTSLLMRSGASAMIGLLALQILLGAHIIWKLREPQVTTGHVVVGALLLATTFWLNWLAHRDVIEDQPTAP
ncbi:MAG: COX15/CtaA family protein [Opitutaceae bacterium]|nr:COX15/CtaA family protein [Opitutaceae bacterium]MBP9912324.1 COX15/CtaA family protein [Opitutaceae bacterium]